MDIKMRLKRLNTLMPEFKTKLMHTYESSKSSTKDAFTVRINTATAQGKRGTGEILKKNEIVVYNTNKTHSACSSLI